MLQLIGSGRLEFSFPDVHPEAKMHITFERTLRIPDDGKQYHLPPSIGNFPAQQIDDLPEDRIPPKWKEHGGVMLPMYQSEAMWINFHPSYSQKHGCSYPFAIRIATGKVSAITGKVFVKVMKEGDYVVIPEQPWLDGFVVDDGFIRQFVAAPLGSNVSVEKQITGEEKIGGLQIEVIPMKNDVFAKKYPKLKPRRRGLFKGGSDDGFENLGASMMSFDDDDGIDYDMPIACCAAAAACAEPIPDMSLAAGGKMKQKIEEDPHGLEAWDTENSSRVFVHLTNSMAWRAMTGTEPPSTPPTAAEYNRAGLPWFDYYTDGPTLKATSDMKDIKSIKEMGGAHLLPENESVEEKNVKDISPEKKEKNPNEVREGEF